MRFTEKYIKKIQEISRDFTNVLYSAKLLVQSLEESISINYFHNTETLVDDKEVDAFINDRLTTLHKYINKINAEYFKFKRHLNTRNKNTDNKVVIQDITEDSYVTVLCPDGSTLGVTNNLLVFNDIRLQIAKQRLEGYSILYKGEKIPINSDGSYKHIQGLLDKNIEQARELLLQRRRN